MRVIFQILILLTLCSSNSFSQSLKVAAAANTQFVIKELVEKFERRENIEVDLIIGSSGKLVAQITNNAPYHVFISANMEYAEYVYEKGYATSKPTIYAKGSGVLWTTKNIDISRGIGAVLNSEIKKIAIASPKHAPYGVLAVNALKEAGYYNKIENKLIFGSSVSQVNQYITLGAVDLGITAKSIVMSEAVKEKGKWVDIKNQYVVQGMVMLKHSHIDNTENAKKFYSFLKSDTAQQIFKKHGYIVE